MPENNTPVTEETSVPTPETPVRTKRKYTRHKQPTKTKQIAAIRTVEDLDNVMPVKMTDNEKNQYIAYCRAVIAQKTAQLENLDSTTKKVFERAGQIERDFNELKSHVERDMQLIRTTATIMAESIINHTYGGK
jgi:N-acetylmuramoyl-L-alanine amidase CwlA